MSKTNSRFTFKPKHKRLLNVVLLVACVFAGVFVISKTFSDNLVYYYSPTELEALKTSQPQKYEGLKAKKFRVGGLVKEGTIEKRANENSIETDFILTDETTDIKVTFKGILPPLFRELQGIVAEGKLAEGDEHTFSAENLLTKHDENYMPPEVADSLKKKIHDSKTNNAK